MFSKISEGRISRDDIFNGQMVIKFCFRLQDEYVEAVEREDHQVMETTLANYHQLMESVKARIRKETMRSAKALVTHALFPEILRPVTGKFCCLKEVPIHLK